MKYEALKRAWTRSNLNVNNSYLKVIMQTCIVQYPAF